MSSRKKPAEQPSIESIIVKLEPIFGVSPRKYVPVIWTVLLISVVFLLLILPGIRRNGTFMTIQSLPPDASVQLDGVRLGTTGEELFMPRGRRTLTISRPGFQSSVQEINLRGKIFASRILPRRATMAARLVPEPETDIFAMAFTEFAAWAATGSERKRYAIPPSLTTGARDALQSATVVDPRVTSAALPLAIDERHLADILRSRFLLQSGGAPPGLSTLTVFVDDILRQAERNPEILSGTAELLEPERRAALGIDPVDQAAAMEGLLASADFNYASTAIAGTGTRSIGGLSFVEIPGTTAPVGDLEVVSGGYLPRSGATPAMASVDDFLVGAQEVTRNQFMQFIMENPDWKPENLSNLVTLGLTDEGYLGEWVASSPRQGYGDTPVAEVSWNAAMAYGEWFSRRYLEGTGLRATLPTEDQWEIAGRLNLTVSGTAELPEGLKNAQDADTGRLGIMGMAGNVREWCISPYRYNENLYRTREGRFFDSGVDGAPEPSEKAVRGGAHIDGNLPYPVAVRGGLSPETTSPVIGFRLVLVR